MKYYRFIQFRKTIGLGYEVGICFLWRYAYWIFRMRINEFSDDIISSVTREDFIKVGYFPVICGLKDGNYQLMIQILKLIVPSYGV